MNICKEARIAANLARLWPILGRERGNRLAARFGVNPGILTRARQLAEFERSILNQAVPITPTRRVCN